MKKLLSSFILITTLISCEKIGDLKFSESIPGGCAVDKGSAQKNSFTTDIDKVTYSIIDGNLDLFVGFNATCCSQFSGSSSIKGDSLIIKILTTQEGLCDCICYYTYDFKFIGSGENYKYKVTVDNNLTFTGKIKP
jgi:hypothetical protein